MNLRYSSSPHWSRVAAGLLGLLAASGSSYAQTLYNKTGGTFAHQSDLYTRGTFQNAGTYVPTAGTLLVVDGNFQNDGSIAASGTTGTIRLQESSPTQSRSLTLNGEALPNLTLDVPANTTMSSNGTINGTLTLLQGHLLSADYILTLGPNATIVGEADNHYAKGQVTQTRTLSGSAAIDFGNMGVTLNPNSASFPLTVSRRTGTLISGVSYGTNPSMGNRQGIDRIWVLNSPTNQSASPVTMTLSWLADNDHGLAFSGVNAQVWRSDNNGATWQAQGAVQDGSNHRVSVEITNLNALYTVSTTAVPLPVELVAFTAQLQGHTSLLRWQTASERNSAYFEVQASTTGVTWKTLDRVAATGTSITAQRYQYQDLTRYQAPIVYYRLRQVDQDGRAHMSPTVSLKSASAAWEVVAYPNPYTTELTARLTSRETGPVTLTLFDQVGHVVMYRQVAGVPGLQTIALEVASVPAGVYALRVRQNAHVSTSRVIRR